MPLSLVTLSKALGDMTDGITIYVAPCLSAGSIASAFYPPLGVELSTAFTLGFFAAVGPIYLFYASAWSMRGLLSEYLSWKSAKLIQAKEYDELRRAALAWFLTRRHRSRTPLSEPPSPRD